jgi:hypothetical protein
MDLKCEQKKKSTKTHIFLNHRALPWHIGSVAGLVLPSPGFKTTPVCVKFMVDTVPLGQDYFREIRN